MIRVLNKLNLMHSLIDKLFVDVVLKTTELRTKALLKSLKKLIKMVDT